MSPELQCEVSPTDLGLWPKDSEHLYLRRLDEDMTPTLREYIQCPKGYVLSFALSKKWVKDKAVWF